MVGFFTAMADLVACFCVIDVGVYVRSSTLAVTAHSAPVEDGDLSVCVVRLAFMDSVILALVQLSASVV